MRKYSTIKYDRRTPQCQVICTLSTTPVFLTITGSVQVDGLAEAGVEVAFSGASSVFTNDSGIYSITVPYFYTGIATPLRADGVFTPAFRSYVNLSQNQVNQNYTFASTYSISGGVYSEGTGVFGIAVILTDTGTQFTDAEGLFAFSVARGYSGTLLCATEFEGSFIPASYVYGSVVGALPNQDFTFSGTIFVISDDEGTIIGDDEGVVIGV